MEFIDREKETPILGSRKVSLYRISDPVLLSWFVLTYPQMAEIASGTAKLNDLYRVFSVRFEDLAREFLLLKRPIEFETLGRWWFKGEEINIVALSRDAANLIEVKWKDLSEGDARRVLRELEGKARFVRFGGAFRFGLIARSVEGKEGLRKRGYLVWDLRDFLKGERLISHEGEV